MLADGSTVTPEAVAAARGDDEALALLVRTYHDRVYRFGLQVCQDPRDTEDAVQEAFAKLVTRPQVVRHPGALSWLMTVVRHTCYRLLRPFRREREAPLDTVAEPVSDRIDAQAALERWELVRSIHAAIARLEPASREVLVMRDLEGLSGKATCTALGIPLATMKTRLHRARAELRAALATAGG